MSPIIVRRDSSVELLKVGFAKKLLKHCARDGETFYIRNNEEAKRVSPYEDDGGEEGAEDSDGCEYQRHQRPRTRPRYDLGGEFNAARHRGIRSIPGIAVLARVVIHVGVLPAGDAAPTAGFLEIVRFFIIRSIVK